jgi:predicted DNA binding CopG/RHH family protein
MKSIKKIPNFASNTQETAFWKLHDSTEYIDWEKAKHATFPNLKPSTKTISFRLPESLLNEIRTLANKEDIPYQSFMKMLLVQSVHAFRKQ